MDQVQPQDCAGEMVVYYSGAAWGCSIPDNILHKVMSTFARFEVNWLQDGTVSVRVPKKEMEISKRFREDIHQLLKEIEKGDSVLAAKLARRHRF